MRHVGAISRGLIILVQVGIDTCRSDAVTVTYASLHLCVYVFLLRCSCPNPATAIRAETGATTKCTVSKQHVNDVPHGSRDWCMTRM